MHFVCLFRFFISTKTSHSRENRIYDFSSEICICLATLGTLNTTKYHIWHVPIDAIPWCFFFRMPLTLPLFLFYTHKRTSYTVQNISAFLFVGSLILYKVFFSCLLFDFFVVNRRRKKIKRTNECTTHNCGEFFSQLQSTSSTARSKINSLWFKMEQKNKEKRFKLNITKIRWNNQIPQRN